MLAIGRLPITKVVFAAAGACAVVVSVARGVFVQGEPFSALALVAQVAQGAFLLGVAFLHRQLARGQQCYGQCNHQMFRNGACSHGTLPSGAAVLPV